MARNLPEGWLTTTVGSVCTILDSKRIPLNSSERNKRIQGKPIEDLFPYYGATGEAGKIDDYLFDGEHVLLGEDAAPFLEPHKGVAYLVNGKFWVNNHAHILRLASSNKFLCYCLTQTDYRPYVTGTTRLKLNQARLKEIPLPFPPLNEQKRIVTKIEELFSELDAGEESFKQARKQLGIYRQSLLKQAFEGKLTEQWRADNPDKLEDPKQLLARIQQERETRHQQQLTDCQQATQQWEQNGKKNKKPTKPTKLAALELFDRDELPDSAGVPEGWLLFPYGLLCSIVRNGISQKPQGTSGYKISRISAVRPRFFDYEDYRYISCDEDTASNFSLTKGDLIFTRYNGARRYVGVCAQFTGKEPRLYPDKLIRTRPDLPTIDSSFLEYALNSGPSRAWLETKIRTTAGQSGVSGGDIKAMPAPLCSLPEQQEIVRLLEEQFTVIEQNEREIDAALERSAALRQSILKRAFTGQLVPQDPTDEPASVLLERIQAERKAQSELGRAKKTAKKKTARKLARKSVTREKPE